MEKIINKKIIEIIQEVNDIIPVEWDDLFIVISLDKTYSGQVYFYFKYQSNYHYNLEIPKDFGGRREDIFSQTDVLFEKAQALKKVFVDNELASWDVCRLQVDRNKKLTVDFDYTPWMESEYGPTDRRNYFCYKYLGREARDVKELEQFQAMEAFQKEHNS